MNYTWFTLKLHHLNLDKLSWEHFVNYESSSHKQVQRKKKTQTNLKELQPGSTVRDVAVWLSHKYLLYNDILVTQNRPCHYY